MSHSSRLDGHAILAPLMQHSGYNQLYNAITSTNPCTMWASGAVQAQKWHMAAAIVAEADCPALIIAESELRAKEIYEDIYHFNRDVLFYPSRDLLFYAADVKSVDITRQRVRAISRLANACKPTIVVLSSEALLDRMTPSEIFNKSQLLLAVGDVCEPGTVIKKLVQLGYERRSMAEGAGQFAVRGGIIDIFPAVGEYRLPKCQEATALTESQAIRVEFFGDDIDSLRIVDAHSQRSQENIESFEIYPVRELVFSASRLASAISKIKEDLQARVAELIDRGLTREAGVLQDTINAVLDTWSTELGAQADAFLPYFYSEETNLLDYLPGNTVVFFDNPQNIDTHMEVVQTEYGESIFSRLEAGRILPTQADIIMPWAQVLHKTQNFHRIIFTIFGGKPTNFPTATEVQMGARSLPPLKYKPAELKLDVEKYLQDGYKVAILAGVRRQGQKLAQSINELDILARFVESPNGERLAQGVITVLRGTLSSGFEYPGIKLAVITDKELFAAEKAKKRKRRKDKNMEKISHFSDLRIGDYIVHDNHGIGIFRGIEQVTNDGLSRDYLKLEYSDGGFLYVQTAQMEFIQKYIGARTEARLSKLGGTDWVRAKTKARRTIEILAEDLIALYAKRQAAVAHSYSQDTVWQQEFEANFPYTETDDQLSAIDDVKRDMESKKVMDRLICGDVGYGKTEIAIRAAFKAVQDGKQVAYLVPTTILAEQHYKNFAARMAAYPIQVSKLSRFQSKKEQQATLSNMQKGAADIVIGTHRLLSKDVKFKDLGLVIVDEEQRFGVGHKEKLKEMRADVDVLTLTATPIPRTLHFSLTGIRDMSILDEPPEERQPIQTYVMERNPEFVRDAINRELSRGGQVYYLHNRVRNIAEEAARVQQLVPHARISYAHGQMSETQLENIMHDFVEGEIDVLVCTTIIETGLDIPNANTMIIQNADYMGLSQLYQLRGRVGRSHRLAYAYLMYNRNKTLNQEAEKRLQTIREFTEFGAGFKIAMRDLEIRGAGNLLGADQHGQIDIVGYDMYCKLLAEAVGNLRGQPVEQQQELSIEISVDAHIPTRLIPDEQQKLEIYKKISQIASQQDYSDLQDEIEDRFGDILPPVTNLLNIALLKARARDISVKSISQKGMNFVITFYPNASIDPTKLTELVLKHPTRLLLTMGETPYLTIRNYKEDDVKGDGGAWKIKRLNKMLKHLEGLTFSQD